MRKRRIIVIDIETTGLNRNNDEILQIAIINGRGKVLYNSYIRPEKAKEWPEAYKVNKITWDVVQNAPRIKDEKHKIDKILKRAGMILGYNHKGFDLPFLAAKGINTAVRAKQYDVMREFAYVYGEKNEKGHYKWKSLIECAEYYGFTNYKAHDALEDVRATLHCYYAMQKDKRGLRVAKERKKREAGR